MSYPPLPWEESYASLHRAGWSVGDTAFVGPDGFRAWLVSGHNGENLIRAEGPTRDAAWAEACSQAASVGMLSGWPWRPGSGG